MMRRHDHTAEAGNAVVTDTPRPNTSSPPAVVVPLEQAPSIRATKPTADERRHDNPHWPVRSPTDAANALLLHGDCPWHCSTRVAALIVSRDDYRYFRVRGHIESDSWTSPSDW